MTAPGPTPAPFGRGLYAILDLGSLSGRDPERAARALLAGGAVALQLRAKGVPAPAQIPLAAALAALARRAGVPLLVNDDVEVALRSGADGVHLGQGDLAPEEARARLPEGALVGLSSHSLAQAQAAARRPVDYLGFGPVFATGTKPDTEPVQGLEALAAVCAAVAPLPVVAIGGITADRAAEVARAGARAAAAIGAVLGAPDVEAASRRLTACFLGIPRESQCGR